MMDHVYHFSHDEVDQILLNAQLRDELEPYLDESLAVLNGRTVSTQIENEFLASMLAWERAPVLPIGQWFSEELSVPSPDTMSEEQLHETLWATIHKLYDQRIILDCTDHLSDRELYSLIYRDILPSPEKKVDLPRNYLHWHCLDDDDDPETWLRYYASRHEREVWAEETGLPLPAAERPPFPRKMPRRPM